MSRASGKPIGSGEKTGGRAGKRRPGAANRTRIIAAKLRVVQGRLKSTQVELRHTQRVLDKSMEYYTILFNKANDAVFTFPLLDDGRPGNFIEANDTMCSRLGYSREELSSMSLRDIYAGEFRDSIGDIISRLRADRNIIFETRHRSRNGVEIPTETSSHLFTVNGNEIVLSIARDITDRKTTETRLYVSLQEKETLLREIHHRVKNNMQIVSSMLSLQAARFNSAEIRHAFMKSQNLIKAMAFVHERLYRTESMAHIDIGSFLRQILNELLHAYGRQHISFSLQAPPVQLDAEIAVPVALVVTELVTNALKHAFPSDQQGTVSILISPTSRGTVLFTISDDGIGLPEGMDDEHSSPLGLQLVRSLVRQVGGSLEQGAGRGTTFHIEFSASRDRVAAKREK
jgi:PAS domain S-box-containing protein